MLLIKFGWAWQSFLSMRLLNHSYATKWKERMGQREKRNNNTKKTCHKIICELWIYFWIDAFKIVMPGTFLWCFIFTPPPIHTIISAVSSCTKKSHSFSKIRVPMKGEKARNSEFLLWHSSCNQFCFLDFKLIYSFGIFGEFFRFHWGKSVPFKFNKLLCKYRAHTLSFYP